MRRFVVSITCLMTLAASAAEETLTVPSDATASYLPLERHRYTGSGWLLVKRVVPSGVSYFQRTFDCQMRTVSYMGAGDSLQELRSSKSGPFRVRIAEGSVDHDLWLEACRNQTTEEKRIAERRATTEKQMYLAWRIQDIRPSRREGPLRSINIDDKEIREIQSVAVEILPGAIVNIGGVVTGCPCEDGPSCSDQVWLVAYRPDRSVGMLLSKIGSQWLVGPVQEWWLDYENLEARRRDLDSLAYAKAKEALTDRFPVCAAQLAVPGDAAAERPRP